MRTRVNPQWEGMELGADRLNEAIPCRWRRVTLSPVIRHEVTASSLLAAGRWLPLRLRHHSSLLSSSKAMIGSKELQNQGIDI
jgi:hypothetical protein